MNLLDRLDALEREATSGPWVVTPNGDAIYQGDKQDGGPVVMVATVDRVMRDPERLVADMNLTADLRNAWPLLSRLVRAQLALLRCGGRDDAPEWPAALHEYLAVRKAVEEAGP